MEITVRKANKSDINAVSDMWDRLNDYLALPDVVNYPRWEKGIYPLRRHAEESVADGTLYIAVDGEKVVGTVVLSPIQDKEYREANWQIDFDCPVYEICKLAVSPEYFGCGVGKAMMDKATELGKENGIKALRRDTYEENLPTVKFFEKNGFTYCGTIDLGLEEIYGLKWYKVFEKLI